MTYENLRWFADTWGLVALTVIFFLMLVYIFRRGSTQKYERAARIPMDTPENPAPPDKAINDLKADGAPHAADGTPPAAKGGQDEPERGRSPDTSESHSR